MPNSGIKDHSFVRARDMNGIWELQYMKKKNFECPIRILPGKRYVIKETGEIKEFEKNNLTRSSSYKSLRRTFKNLRYLINNNFMGAKNELFLTLTYGSDKGKRLTFSESDLFYTHFKIFIKTLRRKFGKLEYINVVEPHYDGHLHAHVLVKFLENDINYIDNNIISEIWGHGFTTTSGLQKVDDVGAYLSAYLSDVELNEETAWDVVSKGEKAEIKEVNGKKYIKGGRLKYYPKEFNLYRCSRGIKKPEIIDGISKNIKKEAGILGKEPDFVKQYDININNFENTIIYEHFNTRKL